MNQLMKKKIVKENFNDIKIRLDKFKSWLMLMIVQLLL